MARGDLKVISGHGPTITYKTDDRTTSSQTVALEPGEPVKAVNGSNFVIALATGDPELGTDEFVGIVRRKSTETSTADGEVEVLCTIPGLTIIRGKTTTATDINTAAKLLAILGDWITIDLTGSGTNGSGNVFTFDGVEGTDPNVHGFKIIRGNTTKGTLDCLGAHSMVSQAGPYL